MFLKYNNIQGMNKIYTKKVKFKDTIHKYYNKAYELLCNFWDKLKVNIWGKFYNWLSKPFEEQDDERKRLLEEKINLLNIFIGFAIAFIFTKIIECVIDYQYKDLYWNISIYKLYVPIKISASVKSVLWPFAVSLFIGSQGVILLRLSNIYSQFSLKNDLEIIRFGLRNSFKIVFFLILHVSSLVLPVIVTECKKGWIYTDVGFLVIIMMYLIYIRTMIESGIKK